MKRIFLLLAGLLTVWAACAQNRVATHCFAQRDTCDLYLDIYAPSPDAPLTYQGREKPTIVFLFGGGFITGKRDDPSMMPWFKLLNDQGYRVVSIDYRLGLKGVPIRFDFLHLTDAFKKTDKAVSIGVEDAFTAVRFLADHAESLGIDPANLVLSGSSAGAMITLSCIWEISNRTPRTAILPEGFRFAGVISFAGAVMSGHGIPDYPEEPCPQLLLHGTDDAAVAYEKMSFAGKGMYGSSSVAAALARKGYPYNIIRYTGHSHDIAGSLTETWPEQERFLQENVILRSGRTVDVTVAQDPAVPHRGSVSLAQIYNY